MPRSAFRRRVAPSVPLLIEYTDENGSFSKTYRLAFDLNVLARISEKTGLQALYFDMWTKMTANVLRVMLWSALIPYQREFEGDEGLELVGSMMDGDNQERAARALFDAYMLYLPKDQADLVRASREKAVQAENPLEVPAPATAPEEVTIPLDGSSSGPSASTISESPIAKSAT